MMTPLDNCLAGGSSTYIRETKEGSPAKKATTIPSAHGLGLGGGIEVSPLHLLAHPVGLDTNTFLIWVQALGGKG